MAQSVSIAALRKKLIGLSSAGTPLSELERLIDHQALLSTDFFTMARDSVPNAHTGQDHKNMNLKYSTLSASFLSKFKSDHISTWSTWTFGDVITSTIRCNTGKLAPWNSTDIESNEHNHAAITIKFYRENFSKMVRDLSSMYYDCKYSNFKYASRAWDVIASVKDSSVLNDYSFTPGHWDEIQNKTSGDKFAKGNYLMILGIGSCDANNYTRFGSCSAGACVGNVENREENAAKGTFTSRIEPRHFPNHKHKFKADLVSFYMTFRIRGTVVPLAGDAASMVTVSQDKYGKNPVTPAFHAMTATLTPIKMTGEGSLSSTKWKDTLTVANLVCHPTSGDVIEETRDYSAHNNVPPVIFFYLNERRR